MHVLLTTDTLGGVWTYTKELTEGLLQQGCEVTLVGFGRWPSDMQSQWALYLRNADQENFRFLPSDIPLEWMPDNTKVVEIGTACLESAVRYFAPDVVHLNQFCFGRLSVGVPKVITAHSDVLSWAEACIPDGLESSPWLSHYTNIVQHGLSGIDMLVAPTASMMSALHKSFTLPTARKVIPNGRTLETSKAPRIRTLQAVSAGRMWDPSKSLALLREVRDFPVLIAGEISEGTQHDRFTDNVRHVGFLPERELHNLFRCSHIYIAASIYEPFGLAPLEAALCGCALVVNDIPSFHEVWGPAALYFKTLDQLQRQLLQLSSDSFFREEMQTRAFARAQHYSAEKMTHAYLSLYEALCSSHREQPMQ